MTQRRARKQSSEAHDVSNTRDTGRTDALEKANEALKAAQAELQRRWQYLAEAQKLSHSGTFGWKVSSGELVWSDETYRILGFTRETHPTLDQVFDRIHPDDLDQMQQLRDSAAQNGMDLDVEHRMLLPDGSIRYVHTVAHAGRDSSGNLEYMGVVTDITDRKRAEQERQALSRALEESKARLEEGQRVAHMGHYQFDLISNRIALSDELCRIYGLHPQEEPFDGPSIWAMMHPEDRERAFQAVEEAIRSGVPAEVEHRIVRRDGEVRTLLGLGAVKRDASGRAYEYFGTGQDITERKRAEEERQALSRDLEESKARLEEAQQIAHMGHFQWDLIENRITWSDELYRIYGLPPQDGPIDIAVLRELMHPDDREPVFQLAEEAIRGGLHVEMEHRIVRPDGEARTVLSLGTVKRDSSGRAYEMFGTSQDITERKRAEEERQVLSRNLQESMARLEEAQQVAHMGHYHWDLIANRVIWSDELYRIYGLEPQQGPIDMSMVGTMMHPEDRERVFLAAEGAMRNGVHTEAEHRVIRPDGEVRVVQGLGTVKRDASGQAYEMFGTVQDITERKRTEAEHQALSRSLEESKAWLEEAQRVAHVGYWLWDLETNSVIFSDETYRIHGMTPQEDPLDLAIIREATHPEDRERVFQIAAEAIRTGTRADSEHRIVRPNGEIRTIHSLGDLKKDASGRPYQMFGTTQDITERKRAEQALQRSQFYLSEGERLAHMGSWASSALGIRWSDDLDIYWSDEVYKIYGLDPKSGPPNLEQYLAFIHPHDRVSMTATLKAMHEQRCGCDVTKRIVRPGGEVRYVRCVGIPVVEEGVFKGFHGTTMDVTEHELLTQELRREQAYLAEAQRVTHTGSWACNLVTRQIFHSSDENARLYGFDPSQGPIPFERHYGSILAEDEPAITAKLENAIRTGTDYDVEFRIRRTDGAIRFLRGIGHHNPAQEFGEYVGITMDITDQKHAEKEREKLRQLEADLAHINRVNMMGELAAALAHEIKQPIAASITSSNALLRWLAHDPPDLERARAAAVRVEEDANRAADVINSLQSFYKRGTPVKRQIVDVKKIIEEMAVLLETEAARFSVTIRAEIDGDTPKLLVDRVQLQQIFMNLMLNAIEAMKDTGGELTIKSRLNPEGWLLVSISDTGMGLPEERKEEIFELFHSTKPQGTGMGLTITRSIVESYGGRVWATNNHGAGASFCFTLPGETEAHV